MTPADTLHLPPLRHLALRAVPRLVEGVLAPTALFLLLLHVGGVPAAIVGGFVWSAAVIGVRRALGRRVPTLVYVGLGVLFLRTALALATGSSFLYFLQPTVGTGTVGLVILASALAGRPVVLRLARDFCPLPEDTMRDPHLRRFFLGISFMWGVTQLLNAGITLWLLVSQSVSTYVITRTAMSWVLTAIAIGISVVWFTRMSRDRQHALVPAITS
ncbi:MAG TPA: VC0807 family protein [Acidimicrobiia bacterium]